MRFTIYHKIIFAIIFLAILVSLWVLYLSTAVDNSAEGGAGNDQSQSQDELTPSPSPEFSATPSPTPLPSPSPTSQPTTTPTPISGMTKEQAIEQARNYRPKMMCATVMTPAIHIETGAMYEFPSSCLAPGWKRAEGGSIVQ